MSFFVHFKLTLILQKLCQDAEETFVIKSQLKKAVLLHEVWKLPYRFSFQESLIN